ncbi:cytoskeleton-associated protein 5 [Ixodes scapularis]|uniref:cytoskeleton-associated protein 5 n=1 Tax=Ixodes scapularis TaxID=6945 RepID=UPI001A9E348C|nr:cytoskeleton-associated protein 5 [Ixodes scapularis]
MADDTEYLKLSIEERFQHKLWKARVSGYEDAARLFGTLDDPKSPEFSRFLPLLKGAVGDANAVAQEKGLCAVLAFVEGSQCAGRACGDVLAALVAKALAAPRTRTRELALAVALAYVEAERQETVLEELLKGLDNKNPKIVAACVGALRECLRLFGAGVVAPKPLFKALPKVLEDRDKAVRDESKQLAVELYRWVKDALRPLLQSLKPVQAAELEAEFAKVAGEAAVPERWLRSEQARRAQCTDAPEDGTDGGPDAVEGEAVPAVDAYELLEAVDVLSKLPKDFYEQLEAKKWQERKEALEKLLELAGLPKLEAGDYGDLVKALRRTVSKDSNVVVVALAARCLAGLALGLRQRFHPYAHSCVATCLDKLREKKPAVVAALREALDAAFAQSSLEAVLEELTGALEGKNPQVKAECAAFLARVFARSMPAALNKKLLKALCSSLLKTLNDSDPTVREPSALALGTAMKVVGERAVAPFLADLDSFKMDKVKECCEKAEIVAPPARKGARKVAAVSSAKSEPEPKPEPKAPQRKATSSAPKPRAPTSKVTAAKGSSAPKGKVSGTSKPAIGNGVPSKPAFTESALGEEEVQERAAAIFPEDTLAALCSANWKDRLAAVERMREVMDTLEGELPVQVIVRTLGRKPGLRDTNFQVLKLKLEALCWVLGRGGVSPCTAEACLGDLVDKLGDAKNGAGAGAALTALAEATSLEAVGPQVAALCFAQRNPRNQSEALLWLANAIREFGLRVPVKAAVEHVRTGLGASNPGVRSASLSLAGVLYLHLGPSLRTLLEGEKASLLQLLDAELQKLEGEKPPAPVRGPAVAMAAAADGSGDCGTPEDEGPALEDLVPRTDISGQLTESLLSELGDKNWKQRQEALSRLAGLLDQAKFVEPSLGDAPAALRARMLDLNKNLAIQALNICQRLGAALGPHCAPHVVVLAPGMLAALGDTKPLVRAAGLACLNEWALHVKLGAFFDNEMMKDALKTENPLLRTELFGWLAGRLAEEGVARGAVSGAELAACLPQLYQCLEDRSGEVRRAAQELLLPCMLHLGYESMARATSRLKASSKSLVTAQLDKVRPQLPARVLPKGRATIVRGGSAPHPPQPPASEGVASPEEDQGPRPPKGPPRGARVAAKPASAGKPRKEEEPDLGPLLAVNALKEQRIAYERALKLLKWNFTSPREEFHQQLKEQMVTAAWAPHLVAACFSTDFKMHLRALDMLTEFLSSEGGLEGTRASLDLVLKWLTLRFFDTNPSVLLRSLDYLQALFGALAEAGYRMHDLEAASFLPYLVLKAGDSKDTVRKGVHDILRRVCKVFPACKMFGFLMQGLASKNARQRAECLEELGHLVEVFGVSVCEPSPPVALREVARHISDRDNAVRNAALNCVVQAYFQEGERVYKHVGQLSDKDKSLLEERIKRASRSRPLQPTPPREEVPRAPPARPQSAIFTPSPEAPEVVHRRPQSGAGARPRSVGLFSCDVEKLVREAVQPPTTEARLREVDTDDIFAAEPAFRLPHTRPGVGGTPVLLRQGTPDGGSLNFVMSQLAAQEIPTVLDALAQVEALLEAGEEGGLAQRGDQLVTMVALQYRLLTNKHLGDDTLARADVVTLYLRISQLLSKVFDGRPLGRRVSRDILRDLVPQLLAVLIDRRVGQLGQGPQVLRATNLLTLNIIRNGQPTCVLGALIKHLHDCVASMSITEKYLDLVIKCLWKLMGRLEQCAPQLDLDLVLLDVHLFLRAYPAPFWEGRPSDTPLRTVRTLLYKLAALEGHRLLRHAELVAGHEDSALVHTVAKMIKLHARKSAELAATQRSTPGDESCNKDNAVQQEFKNAVHKADTEGQLDEGVQELHRLRLRFPDFDLEGVLRHRPSRLRDLVRARLAELDGRPPGSNVAHVLPLPQGDSNRRRGTSRGSAFRLPADLSRWGPKEWLARTRAILDYGGFDGGGVDLCPDLGARPDPEEPLETARARHARMVRESEDMATRVVRLLEGQQ